MVTVLGRSGLTKAYRSVLSAVGSRLMSGASRWLDAPANGVSMLPAARPAIAAAVPTVTRGRSISTPRFLPAPEPVGGATAVRSTDRCTRPLRPPGQHQRIRTPHGSGSPHGGGALAPRRGGGRSRRADNE